LYSVTSVAVDHVTTW